MSFFFKNILKGVQGFLIGFFVVVLLLLAYVSYCFSNFFFFFPVVNQVNYKESTVLITLHNESELRPTLGFLTGFILLHKDKNGDISMDFHDSYDISAPKNPIVAPDIIERNFSLDSRYEGWVFRDTNFAMQYSQNAKNAIAFLHYDERYKDLNISAVVSLDMHAIEEIIDSIGGVEFEGELVKGENFFSVLESRVKQFDRSDENAWKNRKGSIKPLAISIVKKCVKSVFSWKKLSETLDVLFSQKHILFYSPQQKIQNIFTEHNLTGGVVLDSTHIPWGVNIANIGGKKGDRYIDKNIKSTFIVNENGGITEKMRIQFSHNGTQNLHSDRYFGYVRVVKPENTELAGFSKSSNYMNAPAISNASFPQTSEFDFFFFVDPSSEEIIELEFVYPENITIEILKKYNIDVFTQPGIVKMPIKFVFQAFSDEQIKISECENIRHTENISSCSFVAPNIPSTISLERLPDETQPIFEDVVYKEDGKIIRLQFSEELSPVKKSEIVVVLDSLKNKNKNKNAKIGGSSDSSDSGYGGDSVKNIEIESVLQKDRAVELVLKSPLDANNRKFYTVLIDNFSDRSGNSFEQYNVVIAYPKYK